MIASFPPPTSDGQQCRKTRLTWQSWFRLKPQPGPPCRVCQSLYCWTTHSLKPHWPGEGCFKASLPPSHKSAQPQRDLWGWPRCAALVAAPAHWHRHRAAAWWPPPPAPAPAQDLAASLDLPPHHPLKWWSLKICLNIDADTCVTRLNTSTFLFHICYSFC